MGLYDQSQWVLIFFLYSVLGWVWETLYVSAKKRRWVNRGFLFGPWLPIYGFGALIILLLTLPVRENIWAIFLLGMAGATVLEYVTGDVMERLFHVRYWDYTHLPFNLKGHISLFTSLAWGGFSLLLVRVLHPPIEQAVLCVPLWAADAVGLLLTILFVVDTTKSVQAALDLKALLKNLTSSNQRLHSLEEQLQASVETIKQEKEALRQKLRRAEESFAEGREQLLAKKDKQKESQKEHLLHRLDEWRRKKSRVLSLLSEKSAAALEVVSDQLKEAKTEQETAHLEAVREKLLGVQAAVRTLETELSARRNQEYQRAVSLLRRNPSAVSHQHTGAFRELSDLDALHEKQQKDSESEKI